MRVVIVGQRNGKAVVRWRQCLGLSFVLSMVMGIGTGLVCYLLAGRWSHAPVLFGIVVGAGIVGVGLINSLRTPPDRLSPID